MSKFYFYGIFDRVAGDFVHYFNALSVSSSKPKNKVFLSVYISSIQPFKTSQIFVYINDVADLYKKYKNGNVSLDLAFDLIKRNFDYLHGLIFGLDIKHKYVVFFHDGLKYEYISFYNNSSRSIKYSICICRDSQYFSFKYNKVERKK